MLTILFTSLILMTSLSLAEESKPFDITVENQKKEFLDHNGIIGEWLAVFEGGKDCKVCKTMAPEIFKLAQITKGKPKVARINWYIQFL